MAKIKYTKTEQKHQQDSLKQFLRFLPTLQLKKQQLQQEVRISVEKLSANRAARKAALDRLAGLLLFFSTQEETERYASLVEVRSIITSTMNIAGITIPIFDKVEFAPLEWDLLTTPWQTDDCVQALKESLSLRAEGKVLEKQYELLLAELTTTTQRVNLFEKVKIPECKENIRRIKIQLGDMETSAVARSKIAKSKSQRMN
ncbi:MAG: V-type ATP synthase subunit D [Lentisphaerae bacterium]|nr:V-type ATP synthase subunit D [Lentisphaerota bacterium]MBQ4328933.1 V-type ATP synthase subunit D [Lentisphaeria bacterium]